MQRLQDKPWGNFLQEKVDILMNQKGFQLKLKKKRGTKYWTLYFFMKENKSFCLFVCVSALNMVGLRILVKYTKKPYTKCISLHKSQGRHVQVKARRWENPKLTKIKFLLLKRMVLAKKKSWISCLLIFRNEIHNCYNVFTYIISFTLYSDLVREIGHMLLI